MGEWVHVLPRRACIHLALSKDVLRPHSQPHPLHDPAEPHFAAAGVDDEAVVVRFDFRVLAVASYIYFPFAPTLIFHIEYPPVKSINWLRVLGLITQLAMIGIICSVLLQEWIVPVLLDHQHAFINERYSEVLLTALRLCMPSTIMWLLAVAYGLFHVHLNLVAELTMFGDRVFNGDWWNVSTVRAYWGLWNKPVSSFLKRHVLSPMKRVGSPYMLSYSVVL